MTDNVLPEFIFHHGGVSVPDLEQAKTWYASVLDFATEREFYIEAAKAKVAMVRRGDVRFEIFEVEGAASLPEERRHPPQDVKTHGNKHVAFKVPDLERFLDVVEARGADVAFVVREKFGKGCFIRDCAGNLIEFVEENRS